MDGDLLSGYDAGAMMLRPDLSLNKGSIDGARYFEITAFVVKPGHVHDFAELTQIYIDTFRKSLPTPIGIPSKSCTEALCPPPPEEASFSSST